MPHAAALVPVCFRKENCNTTGVTVTHITVTEMVCFVVLSALLLRKAIVMLRTGPPARSRCLKSSGKLLDEVQEKSFWAPGCTGERRDEAGPGFTRDYGERCVCPAQRSGVVGTQVQL